jgi:putative alpha-1,2-mannosidase
MPWLTHAQIMRGGEVEFEMGARPNNNWGNKINIEEFMK